MADKSAKRLKKLGVALALILLPLALIQLLAAAAEGRLGWIIVASLVGAAAVAACLAGPKGPEVFRLFDCEEQAVTVRMYCPTRKARSLLPSPPALSPAPAGSRPASPA